jgi:hypothetical protein
MKRQRSIAASASLPLFQMGRIEGQVIGRFTAKIAIGNEYG